MSFKILGILAAILTTSSFIPQALKTIKTKDTSSMSFGMYSMFTLGVFFGHFMVYV
jgi:MtN3 and saliva related transmembrane protein